MGYPTSFHRLVIIGNAYGDVVNTSLSIIPTLPTPTNEPTQALVDAVYAVCAAWWADGTATAVKIPASHLFNGIKLNRIGTDGHYQDAITHEKYVSGAGTPGGWPAYPPAQLATVLTLRTDVDRGHASKGRMYLPAVSGFTTNMDPLTGQTTSAEALRVANAGKNLILALHTAYAANGFGAAAVGVASDIGAGTFRRVTKVSVGKVPDTMRSRRSKLLEAPQTVTIA